MRKLLLLVSFFFCLFSSHGETLNQRFFIDFGPNDVTNGNITINPDGNGNYWNNAIDNALNATLPLKNSANATTTYNLVVTKAMSKNGIASGGLLSPSASLLGEFAIATATQDYFFTTNATTPGQLKITGLDPAKQYKFHLFGSRSTTETRIAKYTFTGANSMVGLHQTSGTNLSGTGVNANNSTIFSSDMIYPTGAGDIVIDIAVSSGSYAHVNIMKMEEYSGPVVSVTGVSVTGNDITVTGTTSQMTAVIAPINATVKSVSWTVDDTSVANIDATGLLHPKKNGTVIVTATSLQAGVSISASKQITISNQQSTLYVSGSATENGDNVASAIPMRMVTDGLGSVTGIFEVYTSLNSIGTIGFYTSRDINSTVVYGGGATAGTLLTGGAAIDPAESGTVLLTVNLSTNTYTVLPITKWSIVGSSIPNGWNGDVPLIYQGNGVWSNTVALTTATASTDPSRFIFRANGSWTYSMKKVTGSVNALKMESEATANGVAVTDIPMNLGTFLITLDLKNYTYSVACSAIDPMKISVMGSSVANGQGATNMQGYAYKYAQLLTQRFTDGKGLNWNYSNISINGNSTVSVLNRWDADLLNDCSSYVIYGLSLGNEGIITNGQASFDQFKTNMLLLIAKARAAGKTPVVMNNYTRADYTAIEYSFVKQMDMLIHEWDVPSINLLGAIDNGTGQWATGYQADALHPNDAGHAEFAYAMVPSLFDALKMDKPQPQKTNAMYLNMGKALTTDQLSFTPENTIHSFTVSFDIKTNSNGTIATFKQGAGLGSLAIDAITGYVTFTSPNGGSIIGNVAVTDGQWHKVTLTHFYARGETLLYTDNTQAGSLTEKLLAEVFYLNDVNAPGTISYRNLLFYRAGMNADELAGLNADKMLKSSLEIYAPLDGQALLGSDPLVNLAQSTNVVLRNQLSTGINTNGATGDLKIYPSPVSAKLQIAGLVPNKRYECTIYGADGRVTLRKSILNENELNVSSLASSLYLLILKDDNSSDPISLNFIKK